MEKDNNTGLLDEHGRSMEEETVASPKEESPAEEKPQEQIAADADNKLTKVKAADGKEYNVVNTATVIEIVVHKLDNGQEVSQVVAHEFMMVDHKRYMVKLLCDAIDVVMKAKKREPMIKLISKAMMNKLGLGGPRNHSGFRNRARK